LLFAEDNVSKNDFKSPAAPIKAASPYFAARQPKPHAPSKQTPSPFIEAAKNGARKRLFDQQHEQSETLLSTQQVISRKLESFLPDTVDFEYVPRNTISANKRDLFRLIDNYRSSGAYKDQLRQSYVEHGLRYRRARIGQSVDYGYVDAQF
jgi:hypothetical protein